MWFAAIAWLSSACRPGPSVAQFQHVAEDGDAAALRSDLGLAEQRDGGSHRGRVGVVALVDQQRLAVRQAERDALAAADGGAHSPPSASAASARSAPTSATAASTASEF